MGEDQTAIPHPGKLSAFRWHLFPNKNLENLLRGFRLIAGDIPHDLLIVGGRRWKYSSAERLILELGLERRVRSLGVVSQADLVILYNLTSGFVLPSLYKSFGLAQLEAMACGYPVVSSRTGAFARDRGRRGHLFRSVRPREHRGRDPQPRDDDAMRQQYAARTLQRAMLFTWDNCARQTLEALETVEASS